MKAFWTGFNFGKTPKTQEGLHIFSPEFIRQDFKQKAAEGFQVCRYGIMGDPAIFNPDLKGEVSPPPKGYLANLDRLCTLAEKAGLLLYIRLLNGAILDWLTGTTDPYVSAIVRNPRSLITRVLNPILDVLKTHRETIFAIDLIHEPEGCLLKNKFTIEELKNHVSSANALIKPNGFRVSLGSYSYFAPGKPWRNLAPIRDWGLDFFDFHIDTQGPKYFDTLPPATALIKELKLPPDTSLMIGDTCYPARGWREKLQRAQELGYTALFFRRDLLNPF